MKQKSDCKLKTILILMWQYPVQSFYDKTTVIWKQNVKNEKNDDTAKKVRKNNNQCMKRL